MKDNGFKLAKERSRIYPAQTIRDADYTNDIALLAITIAQAETQLHSLERTVVSIGLHVTAERQNIYNSSVPIQDIVLKTYREQWTIETGGERRTERSGLAA